MSVRIITFISFSLLFITAASIFLFHYLIVGQAVYGDGIGYYSHLHSWVIDHDWDYTNEYQHIYGHENNNAILPKKSPVIQIVPTTSNGQAGNYYGPGVALLLLPFYLLAHWVSLIANATGGHVSLSGYSDVYQIFSGLGAVMYAVLGLFFLERLLLFFSHQRLLSRLSVVMLFFATHLIYYGSFDVINSHFASFFLTALFFWIFFTQKKWGLRRDLILGLLAGLLAITRLQDGIVVLLWGVEIFLLWHQQPIKKYLPVVKRIALFALAFGLAVLPLIWQWVLLFPDPTHQPNIQVFINRYQSQHFPNVVGSLFHPVTGLFSRTPLLFILFGYWLFFRKTFPSRFKPALMYLFGFFFLQFLIITYQGGWFAAAYGGRMYISSLLFFALLLVQLLHQLQKKYRAHYIFAGVFICLNLFLMAHFILWEKGAEGGRRGTESRTLERLSRFKLLSPID